MPQVAIPKTDSEIFPELYGLVVCGGQSSRMKFDKGLIDYHGQPQRYFLYALLKEICSEVFISCNSNQVDSILPDYNIIVDSENFGNIGPLNALLSTFEMHPQKSWLIVGCDYPFLSKGNLSDLINLRDPYFDAVAYFNKEQAFAEPLITIYENSCHEQLIETYNQNKFSLKEFLSKLNSTLIVPEFQEILTSVDTKEAYELAIQKIQISKS